MYKSLEPNYLLESLIGHYHKFGEIVVAYDFDDTIRTWENSKPVKEVIEVLQELKELKVAKFLCYTCRTEPCYLEILKFCTRHEIPLDKINEPVVEIEFPQTGKLYYNIFLDDKAGLIQTLSTLKEFIKYLKAN